MHCHHEKLVIVDDELAFVGGIDLTSLAGDRYDSNAHPHKEDGIGWHDASSLLRGPIVRDVAAHFALRWEATAGEALELPEDARARRRHDRAVHPHRARGRLPRAPARRVLDPRDLRPRAAQRARSLIYLENQFLWSPEIVHILESKLRNPPSDDFRVVVLLPHKANNGQDDTRGMLGRLVAADDGRKNFLAATIMSRTGERSGPLYVHAKIGIVDDAWLAIGSANLNEHSLFNDTEVDVVTCDPSARPRHPPAAVGRAPRAARVDGDPARIVDDLWRPIASEQLSRTGERSGPLYVHAKIGIVDDAWLAIGSANLNEHSLFNDSEVDVVTCDPALARATRLKLWAEHLEGPADGDPATVVDEQWRPIASEQLERRRAGAPLTHHLVELPGVSRRSRRLIGPLDALVVDG